MLNNKNFYPTPPRLAAKMLNKINGHPCNILEPSAGRGDLVEAIKDKHELTRYNLEIMAIENDLDLQATLRGKNINLLDSDFLAYSGPDKFDLIIANPPFDAGEKHLMKALDIIYRGQVIFLLNAETLKNPCTNIRKELIKRLAALNADIEYISDAFLFAERKTGVEVALISVIVKRKIEDDLFAGATDKAKETTATAEGVKDLSRGQNIDEMVADYNLTVEKCTEVILSYFKNYSRVSTYIGLFTEPGGYSSGKDMTNEMQGKINKALQAVRKSYWLKTLSLDDVSKRLTAAKTNEFRSQLDKQASMDFTASNIRQFILNVIGGYENTLIEAVVALFDQFTDASYHGGPNEKNIHYFNGWKTNEAFKIGKKVIIPINSRYAYDETFIDSWSGKWKIGHGVAAILDDIDKVMNYFDGLANYHPMSTALEGAFKAGESRKIISTYFTLTAYKKGTLHLTFNDDDILRRFNVTACKGKNWLPGDYGAKGFAELTEPEKNVVMAFEGRKSYDQNRHASLFASNRLALAI